MLIVEKKQKIYLPKEYHYINNICALLYDQLTYYLLPELQEQLGQTTFLASDDKELIEVLKSTDEHFLDVLASYKDSKPLEIVLIKHITMSILSDMVNYLYEAIKIAQKGKMSVAFSLMRKPFTDQLLILEQLFTDAPDFIDRFFHNGDPKQYDPSSKNLDKKQIIQKSTEKIGTFIFDADLIHELRYDKSVSWGLNPITNQALHIVTNDNNYKTENQNFNFTFPVEDTDVNEQIGVFYELMFDLLGYTSTVIDELLFQYVENGENVKTKHRFKNIISKLILLNPPSSSKFFLPFFSKALKTQCEICKHLNIFGKRDLHMYFFEETFYCKKCFNEVDVEQKKINVIVNALNIQIKDELRNNDT